MLPKLPLFSLFLVAAFEYQYTLVDNFTAMSLFVLKICFGKIAGR